MRRTSKSEKGITLIALFNSIVTIIVLLILAGVTINMAVNKQGIFSKAKTTTAAYKNAVIGTTVVDGQTLDWYLFDTDTTNGKAYLVSTPTYWVPDTTKAVNGAWVPKLVASSDSYTGAMRQAIQKKASGTLWSSYTYGASSVTYTPSANTLKYFKSVNSQWSAQRGSVAFASMNENEQAACYLADEDIFAGIKNQVNNADGSLKGKVQSIVGAPSVEQWCNAYNKQLAASISKITCEYSTKDTPGYIYKVNGKAQYLGWYTDSKTIHGNDIYGAAYKNSDLSNPFSVGWCLASPSVYRSDNVCLVNGCFSSVSNTSSNDYYHRVSLFACVSL